MRITLKELQYIIETATKSIEEDRMVFKPSRTHTPKSNGPDEFYNDMEAYLVQNDNDVENGYSFTPLKFIYNNTVFEVLENGSPMSNINNKLKPVLGLFYGRQNERATMPKIERSWEVIRQMMQIDNDMSTDNPPEYLFNLLNNPRKTIKLQGQVGQHQIPVREVNALQLFVNRCGDVLTDKELNSIIYNFGKYSFREYDEMYYRKINASDKWINRYDPKLNNGKGGLIYDVLANEGSKYYTYINIDIPQPDGKKDITVSVPCVNLSYFSVNVASYLKKGIVGKSAHGGLEYKTPIHNGDVNNHNIDMERSDNDKYLGKEVNNKTLTVNDDGTVNNFKTQDKGVYSGNMLAKQSAEAMAYVIKEKVGKNISAFLSIDSSSPYNQKTLGDDNNEESILYYLKNTFGFTNTNTILTDPKFFKKCAYMFKVLENNTLDKETLENLYFKQLVHSIKYAFNNDDEYMFEKLYYCSSSEEPEIFDETTGFADFAFLRNRNTELPDKNSRQERTWKGQSVSDIVEQFLNGEFSGKKNKVDKKTGMILSIGSDFEKWEIKSFTDEQKKYMQGFLTCAFDGTITNIKQIKKITEPKFKGNQKQQQKQKEQWANNPDKDFLAADGSDADNSLIVFDDNYATGATIKEAVRTLVGYLNINPQRIFCITPGAMEAKVGKKK